ncbi:MAG: AAA family ATPase, partial [Elusimicrobia bacterium]|nr:AAA family ATPase [Elusimicrobiota bacterium]MBD3412447.1 AAA family ATPase [Elusimicrobiota bacterium]
MFQRFTVKVINERLKEKRKFIQVLSGPRQAGKTTIARQIIQSIHIPSHYASADEPTLKNTIWIEQQWETARSRIKEAQCAVLIMDEVQKITHWSETVKKLWDEDTRNNCDLYVIILGSTPLLLQKGLTESLAGRFEINPVTHWSYSEMHEAFGWNVDQYIFYGGYPGSAELISDYTRWSQYVKEALIETTIARDLIVITRIDKPALFRKLFELGCLYSGKILSYQKILGQLQDAGNTTTLAHYLQLLEGVGLLMGLFKYAGERVRQRGSSPKLQVLNTALT